MHPNAERNRLAADAGRLANWKRWGPYLAERQWATVREDYSPKGERPGSTSPTTRPAAAPIAGARTGCSASPTASAGCALRWRCGTAATRSSRSGSSASTGPEGNHGEDVKECYFYLDSTPTHSYLKALYKYPQAEFPYARLVEENRRRGKREPEFELADTGVFDEDRYFDVFAEYAKADPDDILIRITVANRGPEAATLHLLPTLWFRNTWIWGCRHEGCWIKPRMQALARTRWSRPSTSTFGSHVFAAGPGPDGAPPLLLFTENETNTRKLFGADNRTPYVKDAFHEYLVHGRPRRRESRPGRHQGRRATTGWRSRRRKAS